MRHVRFLFMVAGLALITPPAAHAQVTYQLQAIAKNGETLAGIKTLTTDAGGDWEFGPLNDNGQIAINTEAANADGSAAGEIVIEYSAGKFALILAPGQNAPGGGTWSPAYDNGGKGPLSMNQNGNMAFSAAVVNNGATSVNTYRWDATTQQVTAVALAGTPTVNNLIFKTAGDNSAVINGSDQIVFPASVTGTSGTTGDGLFFLANGKMQAIVLPDQVLPDGGKAASSTTLYPSLNDQGAIGLRMARVGDGTNIYSAYLWTNGTITPLAVVGSAAPGGGKWARLRYAGVNNKDTSVLLVGQVDSTSNSDNLYRWNAGTIKPLVVQGQDMPGGGKFVNLQRNRRSVSAPNANGQYAFLCNLDDGSAGAYLLNLDGTLSLILKTGTSTNLGTIKGISTDGLGVNSKGQVAMAVSFDQGAAGTSQLTLVLLNPTGQ